MNTIELNLPESLHHRLQTFVGAGWAANEEETIIEALRRFLDSHEPEVIEAQIMEDVEWGLHGNE